MFAHVSGSHNGIYNISMALHELFSWINALALFVSEGFLNVDAGFDAKLFRRGCHEHEDFPNVPSTSVEESKERKSF